MTAQNQPPPQAVQDLPVLETVVAAYAAVLGRLGLVALAAKGAIMLLVAGMLVSTLLPGGGNVVFFLVIISIAATTHFGVNWCRVMLLGVEGLPRRALTWGRPHWQFLGYGLLLFLTITAATCPLSIIGSVAASMFGLVQGPEDVGSALGITFILVLIGMLYVLGRLGFVFPAIAVEENYGFGLAWQHTAGQGARITPALCVAGAPLIIGQLMLAAFFYEAVLGISIEEMLARLPAPGEATIGTVAEGPAIEAPSLATILLFDVLAAMANFICFAVLFSLLSLAFRTCTGWVPAVTSKLPAAPEDDDENGSGPGG